jgi:hypothetical protein
MMSMETKRVYLAGVILGVTLAAALWLLTYRVPGLIEYVDRSGHRFRPSDHVMLQPWWSVPATVAVLIAGVGTSLRLLPERRGPIKRLADHLTTHAGTS